MNSPVLAFADYTKEFLQETDASKEVLGAVLSQKQEDGQFHLVAYGSQTLTMHEKNYHSTKLEFLALKWAITEHFKEYLLYQPFLVKTDNNPLSALTHITQIHSDFDIANSPQYHAGFAPMLFQWCYSHMVHFSS